MLKVTKLTIRSFDLDHLDIFWETSAVRGPARDSDPHPILDYTFTVHRSDAAMGPYVPLSPPLRDTYHFRDNMVPLQHKWRQAYYKIVVRHLPTGEEAEFGPASHHQPEPDLIAAEIIRQEDLLFREVIGRKVLLYPIRTFGPACTCYDPVTQRKTRSGHQPCFGTGWLGGYMSPVLIHVQIDPHPKGSTPTSLHESQNSDTTGRAPSFPPINPGDILIEMENRRWRVGSVRPTQRLRAVLHQELSLHEIPRGDIEYSLPVRLDAGTVEPSSERNFSNPHHVDEGDLSDIFTVYGYPRGTIR